MRDIHRERLYRRRSLDKENAARTRGIQNCDVAVVCIGEQMDISILTTLNLVSMNIPKVIATRHQRRSTA